MADRIYVFESGHKENVIGYLSKTMMSDLEFIYGPLLYVKTPKGVIRSI